MSNPKKKQNAPPETKVGTALTRKHTTQTVEIELYVKVVADGTTTDASVVGHTQFEWEGLEWTAPSYDSEVKGDKEVITKVKGLAKVTGTLVVQTIYGPGSSATSTSAYGRGTTKGDEDAGDTSLGFHESLHRRDYVEYVRLRPIPEFEGMSAKTPKAFDAAVEKFNEAMGKLWDGMDPDSYQRTDEVGYKKSEYDAKGPRP